MRDSSSNNKDKKTEENVKKELISSLKQTNGECNATLDEMIEQICED